MACVALSLLGFFLTPTCNCDYLEEAEATCISWLIILALEDSSVMDLKLKRTNVVNKVTYQPLVCTILWNYVTEPVRNA